MKIILKIEQEELYIKKFNNKIKISLRTCNNNNFCFYI